MKCTNYYGTAVLEFYEEKTIIVNMLIYNQEVNKNYEMEGQIL